MSSTLEPAIWSCDIGQWMRCFDSCHLTINGISNIEFHAYGKLQNLSCMHRLTSVGASLWDVVVVVRTRPQAICRWRWWPWHNEFMGFNRHGLRMAAFGHRSSAISNNQVVVYTTNPYLIIVFCVLFLFCFLFVVVVVALFCTRMFFFIFNAQTVSWLSTWYLQVKPQAARTAIRNSAQFGLKMGNARRIRFGWKKIVQKAAKSAVSIKLTIALVSYHIICKSNLY